MGGRGGRLALFLAGATVGLVSASADAAAKATSTTPLPTGAAIATADVIGDISYLAAPGLEGRGALTAGLAKAGDYIAGRFAAAGLRGATEAGGFFQAVEIPVPARPGPQTVLSLAGVPLVLGREFIPGPGAAPTRALGPVVFAGYGIVVPGRHDDYAGIDARGKLVVCLRYGPGYDPRTRTTQDPAFAMAVTLRRKIDVAIGKGAIGIAFVDTDAARLPEVSELGGGYALDPTTNIASFHLRADIADRLLLAGSGRTAASLRRAMDGSGEPSSFELPVTASFRVDWLRPVIPSRNVIAFVEGSDPLLRDEVVTVGAHYDHLGRGDEGNSLDGPGQVYPGGDDNASGTSALLEIAEAFAVPSARPRRSVLFAAFTGEEKGLLGSTALIASSRRRVVAMINLDMVGRMRNNAVEVGGASTSPGWQALIVAENAENLALSFPGRVLSNSDHTPFLMRNIPSLFLFTGLHGDYHRVSDTGDKVNAEGVAKVARLAFRVARAVANRDDRLTFVPPVWMGLPK